MFEQTFKNIDDLIWKDSGCDSELDYAEQSSWILFSKWLGAKVAVGLSNPFACSKYSVINQNHQE